MTKELEKPNNLCRLLYGPEYSREGIIAFVDDKGYLLSNHHSLSDERAVMLAKHVHFLPLVHPDEWEIIARVLAFPYSLRGGGFTLLTIDADGIEGLYCQLHFLLQRGEHYGEVHSRHVIRADNYTWEPTDDLPNVPEEILAKYRFKFELSSGYKPKLISSQQSPFSEDGVRK